MISPDGSKLLVANRDSNDLAIIDTTSLKVLQRIATGAHPFGIAASADSKKVFSVNVYANSLSILDLSNGSSQTIAVGEHPYCVIVSPDNRYAYVTNTQADSVSVIDLELGKEISKIHVGGFPEGINYDAKRQKIYVANWFDNSVSVIDASSHKHLKDIPTGKQSRAFGQFILKTSH